MSRKIPKKYYPLAGWRFFRDFPLGLVLDIWRNVPTFATSELNVRQRYLTAHAVAREPVGVSKGVSFHV
nr:MAG TPA: hypothetical protein [Microviridae sp.]